MKIVRPELLCQPNIIKPLHGLNPRTILGQARWDRERKLAYAKNDYCCMACGVKKEDAKYHQRLEAHEVYDINFGTHTYTLKEIVPLCHSCHNYIHDGRLSIMMRRGEISKIRYNTIITHGDEILRKANIQRGKVMQDMCKGMYELWFPEKNGSWADWGLVIEGKKYYTQFKTYGDWSAFYNH